MEARASERAGLLAKGVSLDGLLATLDFEGLAEFGGTAKVGAGPTELTGKYGDCTHFCMPGVPDEYARAVHNVLLHHPSLAGAPAFAEDPPFD